MQFFTSAVFDTVEIVKKVQLDLTVILRICFLWQAVSLRISKGGLKTACSLMFVSYHAMLEKSFDSSLRVIFFAGFRWRCCTGCCTAEYRLWDTIELVRWCSIQAILCLKSGFIILLSSIFASRFLT